MDTKGFYMRKRIRERKTPKAFDKLNNHGRLTDSENKPTRYSPPVYFKPSYKNPRYWVFMTVSVGLILLLIATNVLSLSTLSFFIADEDQEIKEYYQDRQDDITQLLNFMAKREGRLAGLALDREGITLKLRSENYEEVKGDRPSILRHRNSWEFHSKEEAEIRNGALRTDSYGYHRLYTDFWSYDLKVKELRNINTTFIDYLETSYTELYDVLSIISKEKYKASARAQESRLNFTFHYKYYEIRQGTKPTLLNRESVIELDSAVYLIKKTRFSHLGE